MQIGSQNANQIQNIEGDIGNFTVNASFSGDIKVIKKEIAEEVDKISEAVPEAGEAAQALKEELEKEEPKKDSILSKFEQFGTLVKKVANSEDTFKKLVSLGARVGSLISILL